MSHYPQLLQSRFTMVPANRKCHFLSFMHTVQAPWWVLCKPTKTVNQLHSTWSLCSKPSSTLKLLYSGQRVPRVVGCGCIKTSHQATHTHWIYYGPLPCLPCPMCAFFVLFIRNSCTPPLAHICLVLHHYAERRGSTDFWAKPTLLDIQICLHCYGNSSQAANFTLHNTHRHVHKNTDSTQKTNKKEQINLLQPVVCAFMCSTPFDSKPQEHETLCVPQEARKNETHSDLPPQEYMGAKTVQFYTSIRRNSDRPRQKTAL